MMLLDIHEPGQTPMPHEATVAVGIDLGTTNSLVAVADRGRLDVISDEEGHGLLPSVVAYGKNGEVAVGDAARARVPDVNYTVISSVKRLMGRGVEDVKQLGGSLPFELAGASEGGMVRLDVHGKAVSPVEVSGEVLKALRLRAETALGKKVEKAVITVPAYFDDAARSATKDAARIAGFEVLRLLNEPTAAALAYGLDKGAEGIYAVYDLGGGTFDLSLLKMEKGVFQVLATGGDSALGGDDFDHAIAEHVLVTNRIERALTPRESSILLGVARAAKEHLSDNTEGSWHVELDGTSFTFALARSQFEALVEHLVERSINIVARVLEDSGMEKGEVKGVVLVGGATRVPLVRRRVEAFFGLTPLTDVDPDKVVATGAALQAEALTKGSDTLLLDVTPLSLGIEIAGGMVDKIIYRNTPIPVTRSETYTTYQDNQTGLQIRVLQGEREMVEDCRELAFFVLKGIPKMMAGLPRIEVTYTIDADGLLTVHAEEKETGVKQQVEVKPSYGLSDAEIEDMLLKSMEHARDDITRRLLAESKMAAQSAMLAVRTALKQDGDLLDAKARRTIEAQLEDMELMLKGKERDAIDYATHQLDEICREFMQNRVNRAVQEAIGGRGLEDAEKVIAAKKQQG